MNEPIEGPMPGTQEWEAARAKGFGASEAGGILGLNDYSSPLDIYCVHRGIGEPFTGNKFTKRGKRVEPFIVEDFAEMTGIKVQRYPAPMFLSASVPFMFATPDAILEIPTEGLEAKSVVFAQSKKFGDEGSDNIPPSFIAQAQHQMAVMGWSLVHFCVWIDWEPHLYRVNRNEKFIALMVKAEAELWQRILAGDPPRPDFTKEHTPGLIRNLYGLTKGKTVELGDSVAELWKRRQQAARIEATAKKRKDELQAEVEFAMGDAATAELPGHAFVLARSFVEPTDVKAYIRKGYFTLKERKVKDGDRRISETTTASCIEADNLQRLATE